MSEIYNGESILRVNIFQHKRFVWLELRNQTGSELHNVFAYVVSHSSITFLNQHGIIDSIPKYDGYVIVLPFITNGEVDDFEKVCIYIQFEEGRDMCYVKRFFRLSDLKGGKKTEFLFSEIEDWDRALAVMDIDDFYISDTKHCLSQLKPLFPQYPQIFPVHTKKRYLQCYANLEPLFLMVIDDEQHLLSVYSGYASKQKKHAFLRNVSKLISRSYGSIVDDGDEMRFIEMGYILGMNMELLESTMPLMSNENTLNENMAIVRTLGNALQKIREILQREKSRLDLAQILKMCELNQHKLPELIKNEFSDHEEFLSSLHALNMHLSIFVSQRSPQSEETNRL